MSKHLLLACRFFFSILCLGFAYTPIAEATDGGRYVYQRTPWAQLNPSDQAEAISSGVHLLETQITTLTSRMRGLEELSHYVLASKELDRLGLETPHALTLLDDHNAQRLLPAGFLIYAGATGALGFGVEGKVSGDIGIVVMPTEVTRVDTVTKQANTYFELSWTVVVIPHAYLGFGIGSGVSGAVGIAMIFGNLHSVADFYGAEVEGSASLELGEGFNFEGSLLVRNKINGQTFVLAAIEFDFGAEADASIAGEGGYIQPLSEFMGWENGHGGEQASGVAQIPR